MVVVVMELVGDSGGVRCAGSGGSSTRRNGVGVSCDNSCDGESDCGGSCKNSCNDGGNSNSILVWGFLLRFYHILISVTLIKARAIMIIKCSCSSCSEGAQVIKTDEADDGPLGGEKDRMLTVETIYRECMYPGPSLSSRLPTIIFLLFSSCLLPCQAPLPFSFPLTYR